MADVPECPGPINWLAYTNCYSSTFFSWILALTLTSILESRKDGICMFFGRHEPEVNLNLMLNVT
jgi:hypothetical protein